MRIRLLSAAAVIGLAGLIGAACSSDDDKPETGSEDTEASTVSHNDADVEFAQGMIPHHEQAVEMAQLAPDRVEDERVLDLARRIEAAQDPEIKEMSGWLEDWDEEVSSGGGHDEHGGGEAEGFGMMSEDDMTALEAAAGAEFDEMFLTMMIAHHEGAVEMATTEVEGGEFPDAVALAEQIISTQEAEISEMEGLLAELGQPTEMAP